MGTKTFMDNLNLVSGPQKKGRVSLRVDASHNKNLWIQPVYMNLGHSFGQVPAFLSLSFLFCEK